MKKCDAFIAFLLCMPLPRGADQLITSIGSWLLGPCKITSQPLHRSHELSIMFQPQPTWSTLFAACSSSRPPGPTGLSSDPATPDTKKPRSTSSFRIRLRSRIISVILKGNICFDKSTRLPISVFANSVRVELVLPQTVQLGIISEKLVVLHLQKGPELRTHYVTTWKEREEKKQYFTT